MPLLRLPPRPAAWLALIAMLALALVPTVSRALAFAQGEVHWAEVCTPQGLKLAGVAVPGDDAPAVEPGHLEHCAFCALSMGAAPLPAAAALLALVPASAAVLPPMFLRAPRTLFAWLSAQPRAPPTLA